MLLLLWLLNFVINFVGLENCVGERFQVANSQLKYIHQKTLLGKHLKVLQATSIPGRLMHNDFMTKLVL